MNICVLDGHTLNPGDLSWDELRQLGPCEIHDRTAPAETTARAAHAEIVLTNKTLWLERNIAALPKLKYIGVLATGTNVVDLVAARERNIPVTNIPAYGTRSVAQATFALLLELTNHVGHHAQRVRDGGWTSATDWCFWDFPLVELDGLTMGLVGFGRIGAAVADIAHAFGMNIIANNTSHKPAPRFVKFVDLETLLRTSDVVSLHCPLTPQTQNLMNAERLGWMKPSAYPPEYKSWPAGGRKCVGGCVEFRTPRGRRTGCLVGGSTARRQSIAPRPELHHYAAQCLGHASRPRPTDARGGGQCARVSGRNARRMWSIDILLPGIYASPQPCYPAGTNKGGMRSSNRRLL